MMHGRKNIKLKQNIVFHSDTF